MSLPKLPKCDFPNMQYQRRYVGDLYTADQMRAYALQAVEALRREPMTEEQCKTCNGHGLVGGHMADGSGYGEGCPDCNPDPHHITQKEQ